MGANFAGVVISGILDAFHYFGFERVSFFEQFIHALGVRTFGVGQALQIPGLTASARAESRRGENDGVHDLAFSTRLFLGRARRFAASLLCGNRLWFQLRLFLCERFLYGPSFLGRGFL